MAANKVMVGALFFVFLIIVIFLFACVVMLMLHSFQPTYLVDLAEFRDLHPTIKQAYKQVADIVAPAVMDRINSCFKEQDWIRSIQDNNKAILQQAKVAADEIRALPTAGLAFPPNFFTRSEHFDAFGNPEEALFVEDSIEGYAGPTIADVFNSLKNGIRRLVVK